MENVDVGFPKSFLERQYTLKDISEVFQRRFPNKKWFSLRSVERFCQKKEISFRITQDQIDETVTIYDGDLIFPS